MVNYIQLALKLACMLRTYRTCDPMVEFSKYELNNKLLVSGTFNNKLLIAPYSKSDRLIVTIIYQN